MNPPSPTELEALAARLHRHRAELASQLRLRLGPLPLTAQLLDGTASPDDPAIARQLPGCDPVRLAEDLATLRGLDSACARLADGSYGRCQGCGVAIPHERLRVQPTAHMCLPCQQAHERRPHRGKRN
ncbi:TraR/DksA family transcriptional regulator [Duganella sp. BJB1802]|uniref:TraR/DksA family transcriptional regulator n=1 Tax=Duganella sp. BJB1802 TaxID=2744575 RepID=UPI0015939C90|nr:TraR/DksA family transcriptional regulator [Duganella sp. BJB1802]NVD74714.1 TraR/DksA family transcriptional regulator [Duganella sp. BJB1802]